MDRAEQDVARDADQDRPLPELDVIEGVVQRHALSRDSREPAVPGSSDFSHKLWASGLADIAVGIVVAGNGGACPVDDRGDPTRRQVQFSQDARQHRQQIERQDIDEVIPPHHRNAERRRRAMGDGVRDEVRDIGPLCQHDGLHGFDVGIVR